MFKCTNTLPNILLPQVRCYGEAQVDFENRKQLYDAFHTRIKLHQMKIGHPGLKSTGKYMYTAKDLALYMVDYIESKVGIQNYDRDSDHSTDMGPSINDESSD